MLSLSCGDCAIVVGFRSFFRRLRGFIIRGKHISTTFPFDEFELSSLLTENKSVDDIAVVQLILGGKLLLMTLLLCVDCC